MPRDPEAFADMVVTTVKAALAPVLERLAAAEALLKAQGDLRDRVVGIETKSAIPPVPDASLTALQERVTAIETTQAIPTAAEIMLADVKARLAVLEGLPKSMSDELAGIRERVAVAEVKGGVPGPAGKDGVDGMGWDDLQVTHDGERTFTVKLMRGERVKEAGIFTVPVDIYRGVYQDGKTYDKGDGVTWGGSEWHCNETTTTKPGDGSKAWTLKVKRGRDGKDGQDAPSTAVVSVRRAG